MHGGIFGLLILIADVWAIVKLAQSKAGAANKALWIVLIIVLPVLGFIIWLIFKKDKE
jgi:succinate dehydrogenase/fumarate reductase cytochrome b subunit